MLTAQWTVATYTLTYNNQSGSGCTSTTGTYGSTWGTLCTPSRSADASYTYSFGGWYTGTSGSGTNITANSVVSGNLTVYAKWNATSTCSGKTLADGNCWSMVSGSWVWSDAQSHCPGGYSVATYSQISTLASRYSGSGLYSALGLSSPSSFWSSTIVSGSDVNYYLLTVNSSGSYINNYYKFNTYGVACVK